MVIPPQIASSWESNPSDERLYSKEYQLLLKNPPNGSNSGSMIP
jgi:hypothetical protein